jgi:heme/copper-type cytochrome/quinol oxidase subunit 2
VEQFRVEVRDGTVQPPRTDIEVPVGDTIELAVTTDVAGTLRVAELGMARDLPAGEETVVPVTVKQAGRFEVLLDGVLIALVTTP